MRVLAKAVLAVLLPLATIACGKDEDVSKLPVNDDSFLVVDANTGCNSKYSEDKRRDLFNDLYRNRWMTVVGAVEMSGADDVSLKALRGTMTYDVQVQLADKRAGYELLKGQFIAVRYVMRSAGGCLLPYSGDHGRVVPISSARG
jgi:hypothetical protein